MARQDKGGRKKKPSCLLGEGGLEDGERLGDALHDLLRRLGTVEAEQHGLGHVAPPGSQTAEHLFQFVPFSADTEGLERGGQGHVMNWKLNRTTADGQRVPREGGLTLPSRRPSWRPPLPRPLRRRRRTGRGGTG